MKSPLLAVALAATVATNTAFSFCGFYVAKADSKLFNKASEVVLARDGSRTVLTMASDYQGDPKDFAVVIPVPEVLARKNIRVVEPALIEHLDAYSAPRLVEHFDDDPCESREFKQAIIPEERSFSFFAPKDKHSDGGKSLGVKVEARYTVGEYDIVLLSAKQSDGLETWLTENGYKIPPGANEVLGSYIKQNVKFFVAKVNLEAKTRNGFSRLRPLQVEFSTRKFMLPIRLGTVNAAGPQELFIYTLTRRGRVETTNYRTVKLPTGMDVPVFVREDFPRFYRDLFNRAVERENMQVLFTEYAWDLGWCDPCAADPMSSDDLRTLGATWLKAGSERPDEEKAFLTRLHVRYDRAHFPEDLVFQETRDKENFQGTYNMNHEWHGEGKCEAAKEYRKGLPKRREEAAQNLAKLTGWKIDSIRERASAYVDKAKQPANQY